MADPIRPLVVIAGAEAVAGLAVLVAVLVAVFSGADDGLVGEGSGTVVVLVAIWLLIVAAMAATWLGLYRRRLAARAPFLLIQAFALVVVPMFVGSDVLGYRIVGIALGVAAVAGLVLVLRPAVRAALS